MKIEGLACFKVWISPRICNQPIVGADREIGDEVHHQQTAMASRAMGRSVADLSVWFVIGADRVI
jgi:hypothetical protein